jgi:hypothetical protein
MLDEAFPRASVICDNDSSCHARAVTSYLEEQSPPVGALRRPLQPARRPAECIWAALKNYMGNTAESWLPQGVFEDRDHALLLVLRDLGEDRQAEQLGSSTLRDRECALRVL